MPEENALPLNKNQLDMLDFLRDSSENHTMNLASAFGFKSYHEEDDNQIEKHRDYLAISCHESGLGYINDNGHGAWITQKGTEALNLYYQSINK